MANRSCVLRAVLESDSRWAQLSLCTLQIAQRQHTNERFITRTAAKTSCQSLPSRRALMSLLSADNKELELRQGREDGISQSGNASFCIGQCGGGGLSGCIGQRLKKTLKLRERAPWKRCNYCNYCHRASRLQRLGQILISESLNFKTGTTHRNAR